MPHKAWLDGRLEGTPPELAGAVRELLSAGAALPPTPTRMVECAVDALERVAQTSQTRAAALELLAADALLTYAFESAADDELGGSAGAALQLARDAGPSGELGRRAERSS